MSNRFQIVKFGPANLDLYEYEDYGKLGDGLKRAAKAVTKAVKKTAKKVTKKTKEVVSEAKERRGERVETRRAGEAWWQKEARDTRQTERQASRHEYHFIVSSEHMSEEECAAKDWCLATGDPLYFEWYSQLADVMMEPAVKNISQDELYRKYPWLKKFKTFDLWDFAAIWNGNYEPTIGKGVYAEDIFIKRKGVEDLPLLEKRLQGELDYKKIADKQVHSMTKGNAAIVYRAIIEAAKKSGVAWAPAKLIEETYDQFKAAVTEAQILNAHSIKMLQNRIKVLGGNEEPNVAKVPFTPIKISMRSVPGRTNLKLPAILVPDPMAMQRSIYETTYGPDPGTGGQPFVERSVVAHSQDKKPELTLGGAGFLLLLAGLL